MLFSFLFFINIFFIFQDKVFAALFINEFSSGTSNDWVEIYNSDIVSVDLSNYILRDSTSTNKLSLSGEISGNNFATFDWSKKLNNSGDTIRLLKSDETPIDQIIYGSSGNVPAPLGEQTVGRSPDGSQNIVILSSSSRDSSNNTATAVPTATLTPTETPTPTKTPTPSPTSKPAATNTSVPTQKAVTNIPTKIVIATKSLTGKISPSLSLTSVLGTAEAKIATPSPTKIIKSIQKKSNSFQWILIGSGIICFVAAGIAAWWFYFKKGIHGSDSTNNDFS